jgi:hypothetical protein
MTATPETQFTDQKLAAFKPLAEVIEKAITETPIRLGSDDWGTVLAARLLLDVSVFMGRTLGPDAAILAEVQAERERQDAKWGPQNHPDGTGGSGRLHMADRYRAIADKAAEAGTLTWQMISDEEHAEAMAEDDPIRLRAELIQDAAVKVAWVGAIDRRLAS